METALGCIIGIDAENRIAEFNPAAELTFGYVRADVLGCSLIGLLIPPALREAHRQGTGALTGNLRRTWPWEAHQGFCIVCG